MGRLPAQAAPPPPNPTPWIRLFRSIGAVVAGYVVLTILVTILWLILGKIAPDRFGTAHAGPPLIAFVVDSLIAVGAGFAAGYLTALIAGRAELAHALALGGLMSLLSIITLLYPQTDISLPGWHTFLLVVVMLITICLGARLRRLHRFATEQDAS